jgi:hypothetical protein
MMRVTFLLPALLASATAAADVYKCQQNGKTVFSDQPCSTSAEKIRVKPAAGHADTVSEADAVAASKAFVDRTNLSAKKNSLDLDISITTARIHSLQNERDRELNALRDKKKRANDNLAGAVWEDSISNEMIAITNSYATRIAVEERKLAQLNAKRAALN